MKQSPQPRPVSQLSEAVNHKLTLYALAASSAGLGLLALPQPAEAMVVYTKTHQRFGLFAIAELLPHQTWLSRPCLAGVQEQFPG